MTRHRADSRRGFALLAVLWVLVGVAALALAVGLAARQGVAAARNRVALERAAWRAEDCLERARASIADVLEGRGTPAAGAPGARHGGWGALDLVLGDASAIATGESRCDVSLRAAGSALDVNAVDAETLRALLGALGASAAEADSLADALLDWRDADDEPRSEGAELGWYEARGRFLPRDGPLASARELERVRGFDILASRLAPAGLTLDSVFGVEPGRVALDRAPLAVLAALPGAGDEFVARVAERRARGMPVGDLIAFGGLLSPGARGALLARYADLVRLTTPEPDAWLLTSRGHAGAPPVTAAVEVRLVRAGSRAAVVRRRTWIE